MASILFDAVQVNTMLVDSFVEAKALNIPLLFDPNLTGTIPNLTEGFSNFEDLTVKFDRTTKINKAADQHFQQIGHTKPFKVGRASVGDVNITASLDALYAQDENWFVLLTTSKDIVELEEMADWIQGKPLIMGCSLEPSANMLDSNSVADLQSRLTAKGYKNVFVVGHHQAGVDVTGASAVIADEIVTVTEVGHGLRLSDEITMSGFAEAEANGNFVVLEVVDDDNFTYKANGASNNAVAQTVDYFARYLFPEISLQSLQLGKVIGTSSWAYKALAGQVAVPTDVFTQSQLQVLRDKFYITYQNAQNNVSVTTDGFMSSGRQIVDETVRIWIDLNMASNIFNAQLANEKIPYTNSGLRLIASPIKKTLNEQIKRTGLNPLNDEVNYTIDIPDVNTATEADRQAGVVPPITVTAKIGSSALKFTINVKLVV